MGIDGVIITEEEVRGLEEGEVTTINAGGSEVVVPTGMTAWDVVEMLEIGDQNVEFIRNGDTLAISMKSVGTKGNI